ncbi:MAG: DNRLRE domain-containing protein [Bacteroidota bacterium]|nr:DNRLRE domain-containing protein [Bacteroidota bacterium]
MMKKLSLFSCIAYFSFLLLGCAEKPKVIGGGLVDPNAIFTTAEFTTLSQSDTTYKTSITTGFSNSNLTGRINANEELVSMFNFIPAVILDSLKGARLDTVELRLTVNYQMIPSAPPIVFEVHEIKQSWSESSFNSDSLTTSTFGSAVVATFSDSMNYLQQVKTKNLDTAVVRRWAEAIYDTSKPKFYGFALQATSGANTGIIGFSTFSGTSGYTPTLVIKYTTNYNTHDSLIIASGQDSYVGHFLTPPVLSKFEVRGAIGVRSKIKFDVSKLLNKPIVHKATLTLTVDTASSIRSGFSPDSVVALLALSNSVIDSTSGNIYDYGIKKINGGGNQVYEFTITNVVQRWINGINLNEGLALRWAAESGTSDKVVFYRSSDADSTKRPKLYILYSNK